LRKLHVAKGRINEQIFNLEKVLTGLSEKKLKVTMRGELKACDFEQEMTEIRVMGKKIETVLCAFCSKKGPFFKGVIASLKKKAQAVEEETDLVHEEWVWAGCPSKYRGRWVMY